MTLQLVGAAAQEATPLLRDVVGARLRRARLAQGRSLRDVAARARVSTGHLSQVERGLAEASSEVLRAVCEALGVPLSALVRAVAADFAVVDLRTIDGVGADLSPGVATPALAAVEARAA